MPCAVDRDGTECGANPFPSCWGNLHPEMSPARGKKYLGRDNG